ncbi:MAG: tetratricopeptide repeat protein [Prevotella sp.]|nr:tetratricopeptide repeat protein [Prevotella sp.]
MRRIVIIMLAAIITACGDEKVEKMLRTAESVIDCRPDSAMTLLRKIETSGKKLVKRQRMKHLLLKTIAMDKLDISLDTITYMDEVAEYYSSGSDHGSRIKAYYMAGGVYRDRGNAPKALEYYRKAVSVADTTQTGCDFKTLSRIYGQIATLFHMQASPDLEIEAEWKAVRYAEMAGDTIGAIIFYENLGSAYYQKRDYDAVLRISNNAYKRFKNAGKPELAAGTLPAMITIYQKKGLFSEAKAKMDEFEGKSGLFDNKGNIAKGRELYYANKGIYYENTGRPDSAIFYYRKLLEFKDDLNIVEAGYRGLMDTYHKMGIADSAVKYAHLFALTNDSTIVLASSENIIKMQALYDYTENQQIAEAKTEEAEKYRYISFIIFITAAVMGFYIYRYIRKLSRKSRKDIAKTNRKYYDLLCQYNDSEKEMAMLKSGFDSYKKSKEKETDDLRQAINLLRGQNNLPEICDMEQTLLGCAIVRRLHKNAAKLINTASSEWEELSMAAAKHLPDFYSKITDSQAGLTQQEINVCILTKLQFSPIEITVLADMTKQRVSNIRSAINKKLFDENGAKTLDRNIQKL